MTISPRAAVADDGFGFGDITAASIVSSSVLSPLLSDPTAQRRSEQVEAGRRDALARVAAEAAEIGLESAGVLAAAAGLPPPAATRPAPVEPRRAPPPRRVAGRPVDNAVAPRRSAPPLAGPPAGRRGQPGLGDRVVRSTAVGGRPSPIATGRPAAAATARPAGGRSTGRRDQVARSPGTGRPVGRAGGSRRSGRPVVALVLLAVLAVLFVRALLH